MPVIDRLIHESEEGEAFYDRYLEPAESDDEAVFEVRAERVKMQ